MKRRSQMTKKDKFDAYCNSGISNSISKMRMLCRLERRHGTYKVEVDAKTTEVYIKNRDILFVTVRKFDFND